MKKAKTISGQDLRGTFAAATDWLEKSISDIDALNVFPVPDGDTGTNMFLTMHSAIEEVNRCTDRKISSIGEAVARGSLMGARGNSGVILSQIWHGFAKSLDTKETMDGNDLARALLQASETAYKALGNPVEGTMLTVIREAASAAQKHAASSDGDPISVLEAAVDAAQKAVANTPNLLAVLREAGVVDAGGQGLYTLLEGALLYLKGELKLMQSSKSRMIASSLPVAARISEKANEQERSYGYCTQFILKGKKLDPSNLRKKLKNKGQSLIVVGDESTVRVHIHTTDPDNVIRYASSLGTLDDINIRDMDEQHQDFLSMQKDRTPALDMAVVAVANGEGLGDVFVSLGASAIVPGGQTMNPSTSDLLQAVEAVPSHKIIILPNNKNILLTAQQLPSLTNKSIRVVATETIPQGVTALLAFDAKADLETNIKLMTEAKSTVETIEITRATRSIRVNGLDIKKGQAIGLLDGKLLAASDDTSDIVIELLKRTELNGDEVISIYYGADTEESEAMAVSAIIRQQHPKVQVEVINGAQPHYNFIVGIE